MQAQWKNVHPTRQQPVILNARGEPIRALFVEQPRRERQPVGFRPPVQSKEQK